MDPENHVNGDIPSVSELPETAPIHPTWLHPSSLVFDLLSYFRQLLIPAGVALFSAASGSLTGMVIAFVFLVPAVMRSVFQYFTLRYMIDGGELIIRKGFLFRSLRTIPINRIQNVDLVQNPLHRLLGVAEVRVETASGTETEARLRVLSIRQVVALRREIFREQDVTSPENAGISSHGENLITESTSTHLRDVDGRTLVTIPMERLLRAGLASDRGMLLIGVVVGLFWQLDLENQVDLRGLLRFIPQFDGTVWNTFIWTAAILGVLLLLRILGVFWYLLRFYDYRLSRFGEDLRVSCGLFTRVSATIPRNRIQFISIHRTFLMKWMGLAAVRIETAGSGGGQAENASSTVSRRWFVPVIPEQMLPELLSELRSGLTLDEHQLAWQPLATNALSRMIRMSVVGSLILGVAGYFAIHAWGWIAGLVAMPLLAWWSRKKSKAMRYCRTDDKIVYRNGVLHRKTSMTFFDKVQTARFEQSPFDRRWNQGRLVVDTAAAGPAEHVISVRFLDAEFAKAEFRHISAIASTMQPDFG